jgi:acyl-CoA thioester hydrolase
MPLFLSFIIYFMKPNSQQLSIRWADLDPNFHLRHTAYYDFAAQARIDLLDAIGLTVSFMQQKGLGPVLFREECVFRREIRYGDQIQLTSKLKNARRDFSRFSIQHEFVRDDGTVCAVLTIDAAWIDTRIRKLTIPPSIGLQKLETIPKAEDFIWDNE